ncbi:DUF1128 domain-containing protein [Salirhabdus sp. Marseille-P4669]|uniref:DUF1128 domain-containing protein n=1 Tax=Salirhabdus sp. Marseille-P4669 TaxID=2042310 RepID=UPI000C795C13|nr:DUF1128 family protein [Salirhabdus sp. Marseille-P4669]
MSLEATEQNLASIINGLADYLKVINRSILDPEHYQLEHFEEIHGLYNMVKSKGSLSVSEIQAVLEELSKYRAK